MQAIAIEQNNLSNQSHGFSNTSGSKYDLAQTPSHINHCVLEWHPIRLAYTPIATDN